ncbi:MAG: SAM-dependent methyltransferase [Deltaproteobacteria bacterium]|nr:SAM-dependent methyltransferase [Deltaproteobacteria bacterium]
MHASQPSQTAERAALLRAAHRRLDAPPILDDPLAGRLVGAARIAELRAQRRARDPIVLQRLRASIAIRSRYAEDCLRDALVRGVRQYVILGAGLDSFAYRCELPADALRVFEVDHPATQAWKRERLAAAGIAEPDRVHFVPCDFERQALHDALLQGGVDLAQPLFVSWLGVTMYLERAAVLATLRVVGSCAPGSEIVFEYVRPLDQLPPLAAAAVEGLQARAAAVGEPWRSAFDPAALAQDIAAVGLTVVEDCGADESYARYCRDRSDGLRPGGSSRLMRARKR